MTTPADRYSQALRAYQGGDHRQAEQHCLTLLQIAPLHPDAIHLLGILFLEAGAAARSIGFLHHATLLRPENAAFHHTLGEAWRTWGGPEQAVACFRTALCLEPTLSVAHNSLGQVFLERGQLAEAEQHLREAIRLRPDYARAHNNLGRLHDARSESELAATAFAEAVRLQPGYAVAHNNLGAVLHRLGRHEQAEGHLRQALQIQTTYPEAHYNLGNVFFGLGKPAEAAVCFREAIRLRPEYAKAHNNLGLALRDLKQPEAAQAAFETAIRLVPDFADAVINLGCHLLNQLNYDAALPVLERGLALQPSNVIAFANCAEARRMLCDWHSYSTDLKRLESEVRDALAGGKASPITPFNALSLPWSPEFHLAIARSHARQVSDNPELQRSSVTFQHAPTRTGRLRLGYLSSDFRQHPIMQQAAGLFGLHDRREFEVHAYSFGPDDGSDDRRRVMRESDAFHDINALSAVEGARRIDADGIHILIDLIGYTGYSRPNPVALRPAPILVNYFGYPGTMGADFIDYIIADPVVAPAEARADFSEQVVWLPHTYMPTDNQQTIAQQPATRRQQNLPDEGVVFCSFNNSYKIEPGIFAVWMNLLRAVPGSVLWLTGNATVQRNLRAEAEKLGVAPARLVFAERTHSKAAHLARLVLADLVLDTPYYNAHVTLADALWVGVPAVTHLGKNFAGRVAASLLTAIGLPELIATDREGYQRLALSLATTAGALQAIRTKLAAQRTTWPLFDTPRYVRNLERAYRAMWENYAAGRPPRDIRVRESES